MAPQNFCFVVLLVACGGTFQLNTHLCLGTRRRFPLLLQGAAAYEDERPLRLIIDPLLLEKGAEAHVGVDYKWP